jgi:hypothetical protein
MHNQGQKARQASRAETIPNASSLKLSTPRASADDSTGHGQKRIIEVDFCELADGTLLEMIEDPHDVTKTLLAICKDGRVRHAKKLVFGNQVFVPIPRDTEIIRHVRLAAGTKPCKSAEALLTGIITVLRYTLELSKEELILLGSFVLSTWLVEKLPIAPYVALVGPPGSGKTTALRVLSLLCRWSLLTADISSAAFYELCDRMTTTLLIDETATVDNRRQLLHLLRSGTTQDFVAIRKGNTYKSYGARVVSWLELPNDAALNSRCLIIPMTSCTRTDLLTPDNPRIQRAAQKLRRQLLQFRLLNYKTLMLPKISGEEELRPRTRDLLRALALPLGKEKQSCELLRLLLKQQESVREVLSAFESSVLDSLYDVIHAHPELNGLKVGQLAERVNANLRQRGERGKLTDKRVGNLLTSLHLTHRSRINTGCVLWLTRETREQIHALAHTYGVDARPTPKASAACEQCKSMAVHPTSSAKTIPVKESAPVTANKSREHGEHREHGKRRVRRKPDRRLRFPITWEESGVEESGPVEANNSHELGERRERGIGRARRKPARTVWAKILWQD